MSDYDMPPEEDDAKLPGKLWLVRQVFRRAHEQLDVTIDMLNVDDESDPAPSVPPA
jgi:hypothetical protein